MQRHPMQVSELTGLFWGGGKKVEIPEDIQVDVGRTCKPDSNHKDSK